MCRNTNVIPGHEHRLPRYGPLDSTCSSTTSTCVATENEVLQRPRRVLLVLMQLDNGNLSLQSSTIFSSRAATPKTSTVFTVLRQLRRKQTVDLGSPCPRNALSGVRSARALIGCLHSYLRQISRHCIRWILPICGERSTCVSWVSRVSRLLPI